jgi:hypothetical protein
MRKRAAALIIWIFLLANEIVFVRGADVPWIRAGIETNVPLWGIRGGLNFALHPAGFTRGQGGPRGLIRLGYPTLTNDAYDLVNFIAVEPIVKGRKGFSELEKSSFDQKPGKMFWAGTDPKPDTALRAGELKSLPGGVEEFSLPVRVERFDNGAHVRLILSQRSDAPNELRLTVQAEEDSAPIEMCILTATMGNKARARLLLLEDGPVSSLQLYPDYKEDAFAPHRIFGLARLPRNRQGDVVVAILNDEENPAAVQPFGRPHFWDYRGGKVLQYWRKPSAEVTPGLACAVNGRFTYWGSKQPIPGGISFENFEMREPFRSGQTTIFGIQHGGPGADFLMKPQ